MGSAQSDGHAAAEPAVIVPGNHDGVHLGHQALVRRARGHADAHGLKVRVLTFDPHPAVLLAPERAPAPLTTPERRVELLRHAGADEVHVQAFTREFAAQSPAQFLDWLRAHAARTVVVGPDFRFGRARSGDVGTLKACPDFETLQEDNVTLDGRRVSSSAVREAVARGDVTQATRLLGHLHDVAGEVQRGDQRGRTLGFPTANLDADPVLTPQDGVYAVVVRRLAAPATAPLLWGVANLGQRPTFDASPSFEIHLFDFAQDLYGERLRVGFVARVRDERRFDSRDALVEQIAHDCDAARATLSAQSPEAWSWT